MYQTREERQNFYLSTEWRRLRRYKLDLYPLCEVCKANDIMNPATVVDHKIDIKDNEYLSLDLRNLTSMCESCHNRKTGKTTGNAHLVEANKKKELKLFNRKWKL